MRAQTRSHAIKRLIKKCVFGYDDDDDERQGTSPSALLMM